MEVPAANIILFDGVCNLCNGFIQFVIRQDPQGKFRFASLQSEPARQLLEAHGYPDYPLNSIVFLQNGRSYQMSTAVLQILKTLGGFWSVFTVFRLIPRVLRDRIYQFIARHRYRWFGKKEVCMVPTPELRQRFLS